MRRRIASSGLRVLGLLGLLLLLLAAARVVALRFTAVNAADPEASVVGTLVSMAMAALALVGWMRARSRAAQEPADAEAVERGAATLAELALERWKFEERIRFGGTREAMPVRWAASAGATGDPAADARAERRVLDRAADVVAMFRVARSRRLVVIGDAGTGKSTLALQLLLGLLRDRAGEQRIPVLIAASTWDGQRFARLGDWLVACLERDYPRLVGIGPNVARALVERDRVLPILDGLDEIPEKPRAGLLSVLRRDLTPTDEIVVSCRTAEYGAVVAAARDSLYGATVVSPIPITAPEAAGYLFHHLYGDPSDTWADVLGRLAAGDAPVLGAVTATPLGLWLVKAVYVDSDDADDLAERLGDHRTTPADLTAHLLDEVIPAVVRGRPPWDTPDYATPTAGLRPRRRHTEHHVRRWLTTLADQIDHPRGSTPSSQWLWWEMAGRLVRGRAARWIAALGAALLAVWLGRLLNTWLDERASNPILAGKVTDFLTSDVGGVLAGLAVFCALRASPRRANFAVRGRGTELWRRALDTGLPVAAVVGTFFGMQYGSQITFLWNESGWSNALSTGVVIGLLFGVVVGLAFAVPATLMRFVRAPSTTTPATSPLVSIHQDRASALALGLVLGAGLSIAAVVSDSYFVMVAFAMGYMKAMSAHGVTAVEPLTMLRAAGLRILPLSLEWGLTKRPIDNFVVLPVYGLLAGWLPSASAAFAAATLALRLRGRLPLRLMSFLDDAHRLGLLRVAGTAYEFRHVELRNHLARRGAPSGRPGNAGPPSTHTGTRGPAAAADPATQPIRRRPIVGRHRRAVTRVR